MQPRKFFCHGLVETFALRREQHHALLRSAGNAIFPRPQLERFQTFKDRFRLQDHALAAAKWAVIHSAVPVVRKRPQIVDFDIYQSNFPSPSDNAEIQRSAKEIGKDR